jgi:beta-1,4-N-acetylglucosaminyltransferase
MYGARNYPFRYIFKFSYNVIKSFYYFLRERPDVVVTTGAHTAVQMCYMAKLFGKKVIFIESFAKTTTPTISGKLVYPIADLFIVQ